MYGEWMSLLGNEPNTDRMTALDKLPLEAAKDVVSPVARHIVSTLGISHAPVTSPFATEPEVEWCLQVVCYGLSLQLSEHDIIKDCVNIYCEWLSCLSPNPKVSVPKPIIDRPNFFARKMINHLYHLFIPRKGEGQDTINRQAVFCHRVLRTIQNLMKSSPVLELETWECSLLFLISITDALLSPPASDIGDQLCERVLSVLFEVWLLACGKCFPSPSLWKTLRETCQSWRHRPNLFQQWNRINLILARRVLTIMYGVDYIKFEQSDNDIIPEGISNDGIVQTWFRFLHIVGNPVELTQPTVISQTQSFLQYAIASQDVVDPCQHPCLSILPSIFYEAMCGISVVVDAFLGISPLKKVDRSSSSDSVFEFAPIPSPIPPMRRLAKSFSVAVSPSQNVYKGLPRTSIFSLATGRSKESTSQSSGASTQNSPASSTSASSSPISFEKNVTTQRVTPAAARPKINSILHLFGPWLFEASLVSSDTNIIGEMRRSSRGSVPAALPENVDIPNAITIDKYFQGRAEALGILCRIFCSKKTGEEILPAYLARFYITIRKGLKDSRNDVVNAILSNSWNLMRVDLDGVSMLLPILVSALETVLPTKESMKIDLRRSGIQLLLSIIPLPLHFMNLPMKDFTDRSSQPITFLQLKPRLANLLMSTLQVETDSGNIQMLLGGLLFLVTDTSTYEETDRASLNLGLESPTNLLASENASMRSASEYSNSFDEHITMGLSDDGQLDSAHALFVRATYLICHRLISTWKADLPVSLAALELLNGLARIKVQDQDPLECRRAVKWICDFIIYQCSRPPPAHSKDLHSSIVAAFSCVTTWLLEHPYLLDDKESLCTVLEVVEYGISGTKSQGKPGEAAKLKEEKELKPVSLRVRDAAEALLAVIFEQVGHYKPVSGTVASTHVDERFLLNQLTNRNLSAELVVGELVKHFRYFVIDNSILIGLLEDPLENDQNPNPSVTAILRGPTGQHTWKLQLRHMPKHKEKSFASECVNPGRPLPMNDIGVYHEVKHRYFPESVDRIPHCKADNAIPTLEALSAKLSPEDAYEESRLAILLEKQIQEERKIAAKIAEQFDNSYTDSRTECVPPPVSQNFQTARLLLSHLGLVTAQAQNRDTPGTPPKLVAIDSTQPDFISELIALDSTSCRTYDTAHIFYVRAGQRNPDEILANVETKATTHPHFMEFLFSLGWPISVSRNSGWNGNVKTSWKGLDMSRKEGLSELAKSNEKRNGAFSSDSSGGSLFNGETQILHWADVTSEIAFLVPSRKSEAGLTKAVWNVQGSFDRSRSGPTVASNDERTLRPFPLLHSTSLESTSVSTEKSQPHADNNLLEEPSKLRKTQAVKLCDTKIFVVWLESFEDSFSFPANELLGSTYTGLETTTPLEPTLIIYIHALRNGLFRIHLKGQSLRMGLATPLIDGMIVSRRVLGNLVRQTSLNMARRKRLENDNFQPPHVRRKMKIQEILHKFPKNMSDPEFYAHFFHKPTFERGDEGSHNSSTSSSSPSRKTNGVFV